MGAYLSTHVRKLRGSSNDQIQRHATRIRAYVNTCMSRGMHVLYKSARVYRMPMSARAPYLSWPPDINYVPCLFNTNLAFMRKKKRWTEAARQKHVSEDGNYIFRVHPPALRRFRFRCPGACFEDASCLLRIRMSIVCRALRITNRDKINECTMRIAWKINISENHRSYEFTRGHLAGPPSVSCLISGDLPGARVISILESKNSGVSYGFS